MHARSFVVLTCAITAWVARVPTAVAQAGTTGTIALSRADALNLAGQRSPRSALARADLSAALAAAALARQFENPTLSASYSKSDPQTHFSLDIPVDFPGVRAARIGAARSGLASTTLRAAYNRSALQLDVDTTYTRAQATAARALLSARTARDADSLLTIARVRRDAGDASDLDVEVARVFAGQSNNTALNDSLVAVNSRAALQGLIGVSADSARIVLTETIVVTDSNSPAAGVANAAFTNVSTGTAPANSPGAGLPPGSTSLPVAAAVREAEAANYRLLVEQRRRLAAPSLSIGFEAIGPGSSGLLPTIGVALPLPLFNRNSAGIQSAQAELDRARIIVLIAGLEQSTARSNAQRDANAARDRYARSQQLIASANRISALSLVAYREGAAPLSTVLDAQRSARETLAQYVDDVAATRIADSVLRFLSLTSVHSQ